MKKKEKSFFFIIIKLKTKFNVFFLIISNKMIIIISLLHLFIQQHSNLDVFSCKKEKKSVKDYVREKLNWD